MPTRARPIIALMLAGLLPPLAASGADSGNPAVDPSCVDSEGTWAFPHGLVVGGPNDNTREEPYASWMRVCNPGFTEDVAVASVGFGRAVDGWLECAEDAAAAYVPGDPGRLPEDFVGLSFLAGQAVPPPPSLPQVAPFDPLDLPSLEVDPLGPTPFGSSADEHGCGPPPDPAGLDGGGAEARPRLHLGSRTGSITFDAYSYENEAQTKKAGIINLVFYGNGERQTVIDKLTSGHWDKTGCDGDTRWAFIYDSGHGGADKLWSSGGGTKQMKAHYTDPAPCWGETRYHIRIYGDELKDTHSPGFKWYSIANIHYEEHGPHWHTVCYSAFWCTNYMHYHTHTNTADSETGRLHFRDADLPGYGWTWWEYTPPSTGKAILMVKVP